MALWHSRRLELYVPWKSLQPFAQEMDAQVTVFARLVDCFGTKRHPMAPILHLLLLDWEKTTTYDMWYNYMYIYI